MAYSRLKRYEHDCDNCEFLGNLDGNDMYYHGGDNPTVIVRSGDNPEQYESGLPLARVGIQPFHSAMSLAIMLGYIAE